MTPLDWIDAELDDLHQRNLHRERRLRAGPQGTTLDADGRTIVNFGANDYLGLAADPRLAAAAAEAMAREGWGAGASPLITGYSTSHARLERRLAEFEGAEAALVFSSGYSANIAAVSTLAGRGDGIFTDAKNHASLIDGCRLSRAEVHIYPHCDPDALAELLHRHAAGYRRRLIVTDSLFSMDGDLAPLPEFAELSERHDAMLLVDEAHATGVFGERGRGVCEQLGVLDRVTARVGTLSKALGSGGGFISGSRKLIDLLVNRGRSYVYSTASPPAVAAAALAAIDIVESTPEGRRTLLDNAAYLREQLQSRGWNVGRSESQIVPIVVGDAAAAIKLAERLWQRGFWLPCIRPPSVPQGESLLRISLSVGHTRALLDELLAALGARLS